MNLLTNLSKRIEKFLSRNEKMIDRPFANVTDPRQSAKVIYQLPSVLKAILSGFLTNKQTLRAIESTCGSGAPMDGAQGISDTTLHDIISKVDPQEINQALICQVKDFVRNKMIKKPKDLSSHWIAIDGKNLGMLEHDGAGLAHYCRSSASAEKWGLSTASHPVRKNGQRNKIGLAWVVRIA